MARLVIELQACFNPLRRSENIFRRNAFRLGRIDTEREEILLALRTFRDRIRLAQRLSKGIRREAAQLVDLDMVIVASIEQVDRQLQTIAALIAIEDHWSSSTG